MEGLEHRPKRTEWLFAYIKNGIESHADKPMSEKVNKKGRKKNAQQSQTLLNRITHIWIKHNDIYESTSAMLSPFFSIDPLYSATFSAQKLKNYFLICIHYSRAHKR